jgi:hypothetical protein
MTEPALIVDRAELGALVVLVLEQSETAGAFLRRQLERLIRNEPHDVTFRAIGRH